MIDWFVLFALIMLCYAFIDIGKLRDRISALEKYCKKDGDNGCD